MIRVRRWQWLVGRCPWGVAQGGGAVWTRNPNPSLDPLSLEFFPTVLYSSSQCFLLLDYMLFEDSDDGWLHPLQHPAHGHGRCSVFIKFSEKKLNWICHKWSHSLYQHFITKTLKWNVRVENVREVIIVCVSSVHCNSSESRSAISDSNLVFLRHPAWNPGDPVS